MNGGTTASATVAVCVMRTNFARTGANETVVSNPLPAPVATGAVPQLVPSNETSTL